MGLADKSADPKTKLYLFGEKILISIRLLNIETLAIFCDNFQ
jgi:hypothetical protein